MKNAGLLFVCFLFKLIEMPAAAADLSEYVVGLHEKFPEVHTLTTEELAGLMSANPPLLLDVRGEKEFAVSHLAGAVLAEADGGAQLSRLGVAKDALVVVYCSVGYRSTKMAQSLCKAGFTNVRNLDGSIFAWANEGRPLVDAIGSATGVHPYNVLWGRYLDIEKWQWTPEKNNNP